jgi:hypothetical protein
MKIVLQEANNTSGVNAPSPLTPEDFNLLRDVVNILEPFANLTDSFQADGVTSSIVIVGVLDALYSKYKINI